MPDGRIGRTAKEACETKWVVKLLQSHETAKPEISYPNGFNSLRGAWRNEENKLTPKPLNKFLARAAKLFLHLLSHPRLRPPNRSLMFLNRGVSVVGIAA